MHNKKTNTTTSQSIYSHKTKKKTNMQSGSFSLSRVFIRDALFPTLEHMPGLKLALLRSPL